MRLSHAFLKHVGVRRSGNGTSYRIVNPFTGICFVEHTPKAAKARMREFLSHYGAIHWIV